MSGRLVETAVRAQRHVGGCFNSRPLSGPEEPKSHGRAVPEAVSLSEQGVLSRRANAYHTASRFLSDLFSAA